MNIHVPQMLAASDLAADLMRDAVLRAVESSPHADDAFLDVLRLGAGELAGLAGEGWHDPAESYAAIERVALAARAAPVSGVRGILIGAFADLMVPESVPIAMDGPPAGFENQEAPADYFRRDAALQLRGKMNGERLNVFQALALDCGRLVGSQAIERHDAADMLQEIAEANGIIGRESGQLRPDDLQRVISKGLDGVAEIYVPDPVAPTAKPKRGALLAPTERHLVIRCAADIKPEPIEWLWPQRIALGKLTLIAGQPGLGKSQITARIAATTTTGGYWPCDEGRSPLGSVIVLSAEDDPADTQIPRLLAAGADCRKVHIVSAVKEKDAKGNRTFNIQADMDLIERELDRVGDAALLSIDPLSSYLGKVDSHNNTEVRGVLEVISEMAARRRVAVLGVTHFNKGEGSAVNKIIGSIAFVAAARAAFMVATDPDDDTDTRRFFVGIKNNIGNVSGALAFRVLQTMVGENQDIAAPYIDWEPNPVSGTTADQILMAAKGEGERPAKADVADFLSALLAAGPVSVETIQQEAAGAGLLKAGQPIAKDKAFRLAKADLGISREGGTVYREGGTGAAGGWHWSLPGTAKAPQNAYGAPPERQGALANPGRLSDEGGQ
jgi:putative DNA primase/helicase